MATTENNPESVSTQHGDATDVENKKGQMLVIYLPEGSVIVDRTDIGSTDAPEPINERIVRVPNAQQTPVEPVISSPQPIHHTLQELVQLTVQEVMQKNINSSQATENPSGSEFPPRRPHRLHRPRFRRRRHPNWVHGINTLLVTYIVLASILPSILFALFGVSVYASKAAHPAASIARGDLMIASEIPAVGLKVNDVILIRGANTWRLDVRQVVANSFDATNATVTTAATSETPSQSTFVMAVASPVHEVSTIIPKLGYVPMFLSATASKVFGALAILILNLGVHYRRTRGGRVNSAIR